MVRKSTIWFTVFLRVLRNQIFVGDRFDEAFGKHLLGIAGMALSTLVTVVGFEEVSIFFSEARKHGVLRTVKWYGSEATALSPLIGNVLAAVVQSSKKKTKNAHGAEQPKQNQLKDEIAATMLQRYGISPKQAALAEKIGINVKVVCTDIRTPMAKAAQHGTMLQTIAGQALPSPSSTLALIGWAGQGPPTYYKD